MSWDFSTEAEFQEHLDWMNEFVRAEVWPLETIADELGANGLDWALAPLQARVKERGALDRRGKVQAGETVLVLGAGGGIGTAALQVAKGLGARAIGGVANDEQLEVASAAGADDVLVLSKGFAAEARERTSGRGVDAVLDPLGDWLFDEAVRALAPEGRILIIGFAAGEIPNLKVNRLLLRNAAAVGVAWGAFLDIDPARWSRAEPSWARC